MKSYMADFPRMLYKDGLTTISDISAGTKMGILFSFLIAAQTNEGYRLLHKQAQIATKYGDTIEVFEMLLCYWAWLKKDEYWNKLDVVAKETAKQAVWTLINRLKTLFPRTVGSNWKIPKWGNENI